MIAATLPAPRGFSLVELLVALAIVSIVAGMSIAGYSQYLRRANRADATAALLRISAGQERFYLQNGRYAGPDELAPAPPGGLGMPGTERGYYALVIEPDPGGLAVGYRARAEAVATGPQGQDRDCQALSIDQNGTRGARTRDGAEGPAVTDRCWR